MLVDDRPDLRRADRAVGADLRKQLHRLLLHAPREETGIVDDGLVDGRERLGVLLARVADVEEAFQTLGRADRLQAVLLAVQDAPGTREVADRVE